MKQHINLLDESQNSPRRTSKIRYTSGIFALTIGTQIFHAFSFSYFVEGGMIPMILATICKIIFVIVDGANDVIFGYLSEKTKSRWGKRIPWLYGTFLFLPLVISATYLVNSSMNWSQNAYFAFYVFISISVENVCTILYINYNALYPSLFEPGKERNDVATLSKVLEMVAVGIVFILTPLVSAYLGGYLGLSLIYGAIFLVVFVYCITGIKPPKKESSESITIKEKYSFRRTLKDTLQNKAFLVYNIANGCFQTILGITVTLIPMYFLYTLKIDPKTAEGGLHAAILSAAFMGSAGGSMAVWYFFINKFGYRKVWKITFSILPLATFLLLLPWNFWSALVIFVLFGPLVGGLMTTPTLMNAELIDIDRFKNGIAREASFYSMSNVINRSLVCVFTILVSVVGLWFGYVDGSSPGPRAGLAFRLIMGGVLTFVAIIGSLAATYYYKISRRDAQNIFNAKGLDFNQTIEFSRIPKETDSFYQEEKVKIDKKKDFNNPDDN